MQRRALRTAVVLAGVVLAAWSVWANGSLGLIYGREYGAFEPSSTRAKFVDFELDVNESLGLGLPSVRHGKHLPVKRSPELLRTSAPHGELFVVGDCNGLYVSGGRDWQVIEERLPGERRWDVTFGDAAPGDRQPLWSSGTGPENILWAHWIDDHHVRFEYEWTDAPDDVIAGKPFRVDRHLPYEFRVRLDPQSRIIEVRHGHRLLLSAPAPTFDTLASARLGRQPEAPLGAVDWPGSIRTESLTPICDRLTRDDSG
jgi:hypothetical protein